MGCFDAVSALALDQMRQKKFTKNQKMYCITV